MLLTEKEGRDLVRLRDEGNCEDCSEWKQMCRRADARAEAMKQYLQSEQCDLFCYRRRLLMIAADDVEEREWQQECWKLSQHGGYPLGFPEAHGWTWDNESNKFMKLEPGLQVDASDLFLP